MIHVLLKKDANADSKDVTLRMLLHLAASRGHATAFQNLTYMGIAVNALEIKHSAPLHVAEFGGHSYIIKKLIDVGVIVDAL